jgi:hypothetical protein
MQVLLDWSGESVGDEDRLAHDVAELLQSYDDLQLKDVKIGAAERHHGGHARQQPQCCRPT